MPAYEHVYKMVSYLIESLTKSDYPLNMVSFIEKNFSDIKIVTYSELKENYNFIGSNISEFAFCSCQKNRYIIAYNDSQPSDAIRFSLAHELGHYILDHVYHWNEAENDKFEKEANIFARNLISPVQFIETCEFNIIREFGISVSAYEMRAKFWDTDNWYVNCLLNRNKNMSYAVETIQVTI